MAASAAMVTACSSGNSSSNNGSTAPLSTNFSNVKQYATPSLQAVAAQAHSLQAVNNSCFSVVNTTNSLGAWYSSSSFNIKNTCNSNQAINGLQLRISSADTVLSASNMAVNSISGATFPAPVYWAAINNTATTGTSPDGKADVLMTLSTESSGYLPAGASLSASFGYNTSNVTPGAFTISVDGQTQILNGSDNITIDATALKTVCSSGCSIPVRLTGQNGLFDQVIATINSSNAGTKFTVPVSGLNPGSYTLVIDNSALPANATFTATNPVDVVANATAADTITFNVTSVASTTGNISYTITKPSDITPDSSTFVATLLDSNSAVVSGGSATVSYGQAFSFKNITAGKYTLSSYGMADAKTGIYYDPLSVATTVVAESTTVLTPSFAKASTAPVNVTLSVSGLATGESAVINLTDSFNGKKYTYNSFKVYGGSTALKLLPGDLVTMNVTADSKYNAIAPTTYTVVAGSTLSLSFVQPTPPVIVVSTTASYDYIAPFKDYTGLVNLSVNNISSAKSLQFTSNFQASVDAWGETCFGTNSNLDVSTVASGSKYVTTITPKDTSKTLDLTKICKVYGTNSGDAVVLTGVVDPIISAVKVTQADNTIVSLPITQPCFANACKDPGNGYVNAGYYADWSVWGRQYNPYNMPFSKINDIIYAFIGFDKATGNVFALGGEADSWGLSAVSRAVLQYPYMKAHLSFGGWTNNGVNTAPMWDQLASSQASMNNFATQSIALMRKTGFTGLDIDWEWWSDYGNNVAPAQKMLTFYKTLRTALDAAGKADGKTYTLTIAVNGGVDRIVALQGQNVDGTSNGNPNAVANFWSQVGSIVDHVNVMNYDYHGGWDAGAPAYFQAAYAFSNVGSNKVGVTEGWSIQDSMTSYTSNGVPAKKLVAGIPLYVRTMNAAAGSNGGLFQTVTGAGFGDYETGVLDYKCLINPVADPINGCGSQVPATTLSALTSLIKYSATSNPTIFNQYGLGALQPWAYGGGSFVTYDDVWSATQKTQKVKATGLGGTMFWELDGDSTSPATSIVNAVQAELSK